MRRIFAALLAAAMILALPLTAGAQVGAAGITNAGLVGKAPVAAPASQLPLRSSLKMRAQSVRGDALTTVIVQLSQEPLAASGATPMASMATPAAKTQTQGALLSQEQSSFAAALAQSVPSASVYRQYSHAFNGFAVKVRAEDIAKLSRLPGVVNVYPDRVYKPLTSPNDDGRALIGAPTLWSGGNTGAGVKVAVIDTGVDYRHPELGGHGDGTTFPTAKVVGGWDFVDGDPDPMEADVDPDTGMRASYHGTHVAGIIAANGDGVTTPKGVAPDALIYAYRVLGPDGGSSANVIAGIDMAVADGVDVMNLSLGAPVNDANDPTSIALNNAMLANVVVAVAAGNDGPDPFTLGSPGTSSLAITVGASTPTMTYPTVTAAVYDPGLGSTVTDGPIIGTQTSESQDATVVSAVYGLADAGYGTTSETQRLDLHGKIALISRGQISFASKVDNVTARGAVGAIIYNNTTGELNPTLGAGPFIPTVFIPQADGLRLKSYLTGGKTVSITFGADHHANLMADFSSRGPVNITRDIKPDIVAPGVDIWSTVPAENGTYEKLSGTSMATPHVAGAAALLRFAHPTWTALQIKGALMGTATPLVDRDSNQYDVFTQGAGLISVPAAAGAEFVANPGSVNLGADFVGAGSTYTNSVSFSINNLVSASKSLTVAGTIAGPSGSFPLTVPSGAVALAADGTATVTVGVTVDNTAIIPDTYEGSLTISDGTKSIHVPVVLSVVDQVANSMGLESAAGAPDSFFSPNGDGVKDTIHVLFNTVKTAPYMSLDAYYNTGAGWGWLGQVAYFENLPADYWYWDWDGSVYYLDDQGQIAHDQLFDGQFIIRVSESEDGINWVTDDVSTLASLDTTPPIVWENLPGYDSNVNATTYDAAGFIDDGFVGEGPYTVSAAVYGATHAVTPATTPLTMDGSGRYYGTFSMEPGAVHVQIRAVDPAGNPGYSESEFNVDTTKPYLSVPQPFSRRTVYRTASTTQNVYLEAGSTATVTATLDHNAVTLTPGETYSGKTSYRSTLALTKGTHTFSVTATAGGQSWTVNRTIVLDPDPPVVVSTDIQYISGIPAAVVVFNEALNPYTVSEAFTLRDHNNNVVPTTATYNGTTLAVTVKPSTTPDFTNPYTLTISGLSDANGNVISSDIVYTWSSRGLTDGAPGDNPGGGAVGGGGAGAGAGAGTGTTEPGTAKGDVDPGTGGTVKSDDGTVQVTIPAGAFDTTGTVSVSVTTVPADEAKNLPAGDLISAGSIMEFKATGADGKAVGPFAKDVTITLPYDKAKLSSGTLAIYYWNVSLGRWVYLGGAVNTSTGTLSVSVGHFTKFAVFANSTHVTFTDTTTHWANREIDLLAGLGAVSGYDGKFNPDQSVTRAQFAKMLVLAKGLKVETGAVLTAPDAATAPDWSKGYLDAAAKAGIVKGDSNGNMRPNDIITRAEMAAMIVRTLGLESKAQTMATNQLSLGDAASIPAWARGYVAVSLDNKIINGKPGNVFAPADPATRAEAAVMLYRMLKSLGVY